jgi:hypothetical protein
VDRLKLVSDRFGKIGSTPVLEERDVIGQIRIMMEYIRKRATGKVQFVLQTPGGIESPGAAQSAMPGQASDQVGPGPAQLSARISGPLFDWVIENLLKNALDAMEGKGSITIAIADLEKEIVIDVTDTGKGIASRNLQKVFKPGFTTKKRGWGLGLSLSKRVIAQYHKGQLFVRHSELGKGTTFRIILKK